MYLLFEVKARNGRGLRVHFGVSSCWETSRLTNPTPPGPGLPTKGGLADPALSLAVPLCHLAQ